MPGYLLIGDSQAQGLTQALIEHMTARGFALLGARTEPGWSTSRFVEEGVARELVRVQPDVVIVALGGNDAAVSEGTRAALTSDIATLVSQLRIYNTPHIIWIGPSHSANPDVMRRHRGTTAVQRMLLPGLDVEWHDGTPMTVDLAHSPDGTHFTRTSYARWAARINAVLFTQSSGGLGRWVGAAIIGGMAGLAGLYAWWMLRRR